MKKKSNFFRIDERVFFTLAGLCVISVILIAFKFATKTDCGPLSIQIVSETMIAGQPIRFEAVTKKGKQFAWTFGDTTDGLEANDPKITHVYKLPGTYMVRVTVDGECSAFQELHVFADRPVINFGFQPLFVGPTVAYVNEPFEVEDTSSNAKTWEWSFEADAPFETGKRKATHTYLTTGLKYITLKVDGKNDRTISRAINVIEKIEKQEDERRLSDRQRRPQVVIDPNPQVRPLIEQQLEKKPAEEEAPKPAPVQVYPQIEHAAVEAMFMDVVNKRKTAADFTPYLCNPSALITYETRFIPLAELCAELAKEKNVKRVVVNQKKVGEARCLEITTVTVEKKKFLGLIKRS